MNLDVAILGVLFYGPELAQFSCMFEYMILCSELIRYAILCVATVDMLWKYHVFYNIALQFRSNVRFL